jgi:hypothetical protein
LCLCLLLLGVAAPTRAAEFTANWDYLAAGGDNVDTISNFQQRYSLGLGPEMSYQLTPALSASASLGYTREEQDTPAGRATVEQIAPAAQLRLTNDIFTALLGGMVTEYRPENGEEFSTTSWNASLASNWDYLFWPSLAFTYSERSEVDRFADDLVGRETLDQTYGVNLDWDLRLARLHYDYSQGVGEDLLDDRRTESESHLVRLDTTQRLWQDRVRFTLSQQFQQSTTDGTPPEAQLAAAAIDTPLDPEEFPPLASIPQLSDGDLLTGALTIESGQSGFLAFGFGFEQVVTGFTVYLSPLTPLTPTEAGRLTWTLYVLDPLDLTWSPAPASLVADFQGGAVPPRIVLQVVGEVEPQREFLVVVDNPVGNPDFAISELTAAGGLTGDIQARQRSHQTNASLRVQLTSTLGATAGLTLERTESEFTQALRSGTSETTRRSLRGGLQWTPVPWLAPAVSVSETQRTSSGAADDTSRSYALTVATFPMPTLNVTLGATRTERYVDARRTATSDNYSLTSAARLYPDLTASLTANLVTSERERNDGTTVSSESLFGRLALNARLNPQLLADLDTNYRRSESDGAAGSTASDSTLTLTWRPSDLLMMRLAGTHFWSGTDAPMPVEFNMEMALLRTHNTRLNFFYTHSRGRETSNQFSLNGSWDISNSLSLQARFNYAVAEFATWNTTVNLALRL